MISVSGELHGEDYTVSFTADKTTAPEVMREFSLLIAAAIDRLQEYFGQGANVQDEVMRQIPEAVAFLREREKRNRAARNAPSEGREAEVRSHDGP